jgi:hypothetical protein
LTVLVEQEATPGAGRHQWELPALVSSGGRLPVQQTLWTVYHPDEVTLTMAGGRKVGGRLRQERVRLQSMIASLKLSSAAAEQLPAQLLRSWYDGWARRFFASLAAAKRAAGGRIEVPEGQASLEGLLAAHRQEAEKLGMQDVFREAQSGELRAWEPDALFSLLYGQLGTSMRFVFPGEKSVLAVESQVTSGSGLPGRMVASLLVGLLAISLMVWPRAVAIQDTLWQWPWLMVLGMGLVWWLFLVASPLGWGVVTWVAVVLCLHRFGLRWPQSNGSVAALRRGPANGSTASGTRGES